MNNIVLATALAVEPERVPCPRCGARGWLSAFKLEADGRWWPIAFDCPRCKGAKVLLRDGTPIEGRRTKESETMSENDLRAALTEVAEAQEWVAAATEELLEAEAAMLQTDEGQAYERARADLAEHKQALALVKTLAREAILAAYARTGSKKPAPGAGIRVEKRLQYHVSEAESWARRMAPSLMTLDIKEWEKNAPNMPGAPIKIVEEPHATIAGDLSMYLEDAE